MEDIYRSQFRLPYSLYEQLKESADANHRSVNAELVARLEKSFGQVHTLIVTDESTRSSPSSERALEIIEQLRDEILALAAKAK